MKETHVRSGRTTQQSNKTKIHVSGLQIGMHVCDLDRPWLETPFLIQGFTLENVQEIETVQGVCEYVYIDEVQDTWVPPEVRGTIEAKKKPRFIHQVAAKKELANTEAFHQEARNITRTVLDDLRLGNALNVKAVKETVSECVYSIIRNPNALMWLSQIKNKDDYTAEHSLNVAVLSITLGRQVGLEEDDLEKLGLCGMLHDIGKTRVPIEVLNKEGALTAEEFALMRSHPVEGKNILLGNHSVYHGAVDVCHNHHETLNGTGYPRGLNEKAINPFTRMVTIADVYDAITSDRCYKRGKSSLEALKILYGGRGTQFDANLVIEFINCIGLYPVGSIVALKNGCVGIVVSNNYVNRRLPRIHILLDENKNKIDRYVLDLAKLKSSNDLEGYAITQILRSGDHGVSLLKAMEEGVTLE